MRVVSLQSGSNGNCIYVETAGVRLLLDAGISGIQAEQRLLAHRREIRKVAAVLVSHDHNDHIRSAGIFARKYRLPVWVTQPTWQAASRYKALGDVPDLRHFRAGEALRLGPVTVETIPTPHDAADGVGFIIDDGRRRLGLLTDLGHVFEALPEALADLDAVILESNYDPDLLEHGPYPWSLKQRIRGPAGHISNEEAARLLGEASSSGRLRWGCLAHLSETNNAPDLALATCRDVLGDRLPLLVASRYEAVGLPEL